VWLRMDLLVPQLLGAVLIVRAQRVAPERVLFRTVEEVAVRALLPRQMPV
jgi:hypothetical protein